MGFWIKRNKFYNTKGIDWPETTFFWFLYCAAIGILFILAMIIYCVTTGQCKSKDTFYSQCQNYDAVVQCGAVNEDELEGCKFRNVLVGKTMQRQCCKCIQEE